MALPTAQLGQLSQMSMPYSIPTYEKGPGVLEKALGALLVNAATGVASHATENAFAHDNAQEFGKEDAGFWSRLVHGPTVDNRSAEQMRGEKFTAGESQKQRDFTASESDFDRMLQGTRDETAARNASLGRQEAGQIDLDRQDLADRNAQLRGDRSEAGAKERNDADNAARLEQIRLEGSNRANLPSEQINNIIMDKLRGATGHGATPGGPPTVAGVINPNIANFAKQAVGAILPSDPMAGAAPAQPADYYSSEADLQGMQTDARNAVMGKQQAVRDRVGDRNMDEFLNKIIPGRALFSSAPSSAQPGPPTATPEQILAARRTAYAGGTPPTMDGYDPNSIMEVLRRIIGPIGSDYDSNTGGYRQP